MSLTTPMAISVFLLGAASGAVLVSLRYAAFRTRLHAEAAENLRQALFRKSRGAPLLSDEDTPGRGDSFPVTADATDDRVGWP